MYFKYIAFLLYQKLLYNCMEKCDQYIPKTRPVLLLLTKAKTIKLNKNKIELLEEKHTL